MVATEEFSCVLKPFVTSRSLLVSDEFANVRIKAAQMERVETRCSLLRAVHEHSRSLVFTRSLVTAAFKQLVVHFEVSQDSSKDWVETMTNRLQNLCRIVSHSLRKKPSSEFVAKFLWSPTTTDTAAELGYIVAYDRELRLAWRRLQDRTGPAERGRNQPTHRWHVRPTGSSTR